MASFSVSTNMYLRQVYAPNRGLCVKANRADATNKTLISADSSLISIASILDSEFFWIYDISFIEFIDDFFYYIIIAFFNISIMKKIYIIFIYNSFN